MNLERILYLIPYLVSAAISLGVSIYAFGRREFPGAKPLGWLALLEAEWTITYIGQAVAPSLEGKLFWNNAQFIGALFSPIAYLAFSLAYTHRRIPNLRVSLRLATLIPLFILGLAWTDSLHGLWRVAPHLAPGTPFNSLVFGDGPLFMLYPLYGYITLIVATLLLLVNYFATPRLYRFQVGTILAGISIPWIVTLIAILQIFPWPLHEATPIAFAFSNALIAWALFRFGLFNIIPVARELLVENLRDGVIVLDNALRMVDYNRAASHIFEGLSPKALGKEFGNVWPHLADQVTTLIQQNRQKMDIQLPVDEENRTFQLGVAPLGGALKAYPGQLITLRDITD
ncbi:MAG TPA: histidine kinase N-terminal 7TM domain-containing protein, partial [Anaerolineaceae bacterium]|nr:histidine kinase N-terminal 7TM domain-containing protein [Anaerolineaceae bacterium]